MLILGPLPHSWYNICNCVTWERKKDRIMVFKYYVGSLKHFVYFGLNVGYYKCYWIKNWNGFQSLFTCFPVSIPSKKISSFTKFIATRARSKVNEIWWLIGNTLIIFRFLEGIFMQVKLCDTVYTILNMCRCSCSVKVQAPKCNQLYTAGVERSKFLMVGKLA